MDFVPDAPDPAAGLIAFGVSTGDFVMRDDFVIPIDDVEAVVGTEMNRNRPKPFVRAEDKVWKFFVAIPWPVAMNFDGLDFASDRVGQIHYVCIGAGKTSAGIAQGEAGKTGAAHAKINFA